MKREHGYVSKNAYHKLRRGKLIEIIGEDGGRSIVRLNNKGQEKVRNFSVDEIKIKKPEKWENGQDIALIKHHISYYPQIIAFVHFKCHEKIHDPDNPIQHLIQYQDGDSLKFYKEKTEREKKNEI